MNILTNEYFNNLFTAQGEIAHYNQRTESTDVGRS